MGEFDWNGRAYQGVHEPIVTRELWDRVQEILDGRRAKRRRRARHNFAFSSLISCGHCGCAIVAEIKKARYVYYHCSGYKGKCPEPYVREEVLEQKFSELLDRLTFDAEVLDWVRAALTHSHDDERQAHDEAIERLQAEYTRLQNRLDAMYVDKLDGRIDSASFERLAAGWRAEQADCLRLIEQHQTANRSYMAEGVRLLELASNAQRLFEKQEAREKRRLLDFLVSNCSWRDGQLKAEFRQPFDLLADTATAAARAEATDWSDQAKREIWLGDRYLLHPDGARVHVFGGHHGLVLAPRPGLAGVEHLRQRLLCRGPRGCAHPLRTAGDLQYGPRRPVHV